MIIYEIYIKIDNTYKTLCEQFTMWGHSGEHMILTRNSESSCNIMVRIQ